MINIIGTIFGVSGYDNHTRGLANALSKVTDVRLSPQFVNGWERMVTDKELELIKKTPDPNEINLIVTIPTAWKLNLTAKRNWVYCVWEGDRVPDSFIEEMLDDRIEYIFVPSKHTEQAILNTLLSVKPELKIDNTEGGSQICRVGNFAFWQYKKDVQWDKIKIIPHGVDLNLFYPKEKPKKFAFICNKGWRNLEDRGGIQYVLEAFMKEFSTEEVELIVKINPAYGVPDINKLMSKLKIDKVIPPIQFITIPLDYRELVRFYNSGHVFVSPTRAEAFNIPIAESAACGLMCLTTGFGGQTDIVKDNETGFLIDYKLTEVQHELQYEGISWATPNIADLRQKMRWCYEHQDKVKEMGENALNHIKNFTWDKTSERIIALI